MSAENKHFIMYAQNVNNYKLDQSVCKMSNGDWGMFWNMCFEIGYCFELNNNCYSVLKIHSNAFTMIW